MKSLEINNHGINQITILRRHKIQKGSVISSKTLILFPTHHGGILKVGLKPSTQNIFVNNILHLSQEFLEENSLDFNLIKPLIHNYLKKLVLANERLKNYNSKYP